MESRITDIECYTNFFFIGFKDVKNKEVFSYEVSSRKDQRQEFYEDLIKYNGYLIGFNTLHYDELLIKYILKDFKRLSALPASKFLQDLKKFSDKVIDQDTFFDDVKWYKWWKGSNWVSIDLYCYWSKMLRLSKKISLKSLAVQLCHDEVQELPYEHTKILTENEMEDIIRYNLRNDLGVTEKLFIKMKEEITLRKYIQDEYNLPCFSYDAPKIAGELLIKDYCEQTYDPEKYESLEEYTRDFKSQRYEPYEGLIKDLGLPIFKFENRVLQEVYEDILLSDRSFSKEFNLINNKTRMCVSLGVGGIHNILENKIYKSGNGKVIVSLDVQSMYPNIIIEYMCIRFTEVLMKYINIKEARVEAKRNKERIKDILYKLILNSLSGLLDNKHSPLYYPEGALKMRIMGQLTMLLATDRCLSKGYQVIALNTDSIDVIIDEQNYDECVETVMQVGRELNLIFEEEKIKKTIYSNINNYIQISESGKVKKKGLFKYHDDIPLGDSVNEQVIAIALEKYFVDGIALEETIKHPWKYGLHIYDYCVSKKIGKDYEVVYNNEKQQQLNRYYFSKSGYYLYKLKKSGKKVTGKPQHIHADSGVIIFNKFEEKEWEDYKIDYSYYISKARKLVNDMEKDIRQLSLF